MAKMKFGDEGPSKKSKPAAQPSHQARQAYSASYKAQQQAQKPKPANPKQSQNAAAARYTAQANAQGDYRQTGKLSHFLREAGQTVKKAWENRGQGSSWVTPQQKQQAQDRYAWVNREKAPITAHPNDPRNQAQMPASLTFQGQRQQQMSQQAQNAWAARYTNQWRRHIGGPPMVEGDWINGGPNPFQMNTPWGMLTNRDIRPRRITADTDRWSAAAAGALPPPDDVVDLDPLTDGSSGGGWGWDPYGYGGGGGYDPGTYERINEFWNSMVNWSINRPQGG